MSSPLRRFVTDRRGHVVVAQPPNAPLLAWGVLALAARTPVGRRSPLLRTARDAALACWAGQELLDGDSPFRRALGTATLLVLATARLGRPRRVASRWSMI